MCSFLCPGVRHSRCFGSVRTRSESSFFLTNTGIYNKSWNTYLKENVAKKKNELQEKEMLQWRMWLGGYLHNLTCLLMRVCGWVHARVCILVCVHQNPQTFFLFLYCVITRFLPPRLKDSFTSPISVISEYNVQETLEILLFFYRRL